MANQALLINPVEPTIIWQPLLGSQSFAIDSRAHETLYTGTRGPGKTDTQLMRFRRRVGLGYGAFWRGVIFDREYKHLDDLVSKSKRWFLRFNDGAKFLEGTSAYKWVWPTGEELLFRSIKKLEDYQNYHGQEFPFIGWNELTKYPTSELYDMMRSCNRSSFTLEKDAPRNPATGKPYVDDDGNAILEQIPLEMFSTTNSWGPGRLWVKKRFIDLAPYGEVVKRTYRVFSPAAGEEVDIVRTQVALFGTWKENIYLDDVYIATLHDNNNLNQKASWLDGSWDIVAGGAFDDVWESKIHIIDRFPIPHDWYIDRALDWGSSHPFSISWWAEANGEELIYTNKDGNDIKIALQKGSLIRIHEWYGTKEIGSNKGLKLGSTDIARGIKEKEIELMKQGWIKKQPGRGPADNEIRNVRDADTETIEKKMADEGVYWEESDKSPGSRRVGMQLVRDRLVNAKNHEGPGLYFMRHCEAAIQTIPVLERDEKYIDDVDTTSEDHPYDETRYRVLKSANRLCLDIPVEGPY